MICSVAVDVRCMSDSIGMHRIETCSTLSSLCEIHSNISLVQSDLGLGSVLIGVSGFQTIRTTGMPQLTSISAIKLWKLIDRNIK